MPINLRSLTLSTTFYNIYKKCENQILRNFFHKNSFHKNESDQSFSNEKLVSSFIEFIKIYKN